MQSVSGTVRERRNSFQIGSPMEPNGNGSMDSDSPQVNAIDATAESESHHAMAGMDPPAGGICSHCRIRPFAVDYPQLSEIIEDTLACCHRCIETQGIMHMKSAT